MKYNPNELKEKAVLPAGTRINAKVTAIEQGILSDFQTPDQILQWKGANETDEYINVVVKYLNEMAQEITLKKLLALPKNAEFEVHPNSKLGKWKEHFEKYPYVGQQIYLLADGKGFLKFPVD
jgi:hypothetical protein